MLFHIGLEYLPVKNIFLRAGINQEAAGTGLAVGVGMVNGGFRYDYAYAQRPGLPGDTPHYFSLSYVGERVLSVTRPLKRKDLVYNLFSPRDRFITDQDFIDISAESYVNRIAEQKRIWTVTAVSATYDVFEVSEREKPEKVFFNGRPIESGTLETRERLEVGRNVFQLAGYATSEATIASKNVPEIFIASKEVRVLRFLPFKDTPITHEAIEPIALTVVTGLVKGYPDNTFKPAKGITRAELVSLLVRSFGLPSDRLDSYTIGNLFTDVPESHWAAKFISYASSVGLVTGYKDSAFKPNKVLTRAEGIVIITRYAALTEEANITAAPFPDLKPEFWANKYLIPAKNAGMLKYLEGKDLEPSRQFTRAEACKVIYRVPAIQKKVDEYWDTGVVSAIQ